MVSTNAYPPSPPSRELFSPLWERLEWKVGIVYKKEKIFQNKGHVLEFRKDSEQILYDCRAPHAIIGIDGNIYLLKLVLVA